MPNESTGSNRPRDFGDMERDVVYLLTDPCRQPTVWSVPDIGREIEYFDIEAVVRPLVNAGLLHRIGDVVFATPAAFHSVSLIGRDL